MTSTVAFENVRQILDCLRASMVVAQSSLRLRAMAIVTFHGRFVHRAQRLECVAAGPNNPMSRKHCFFYY
jgi:hypothetical protein